MVKPGKVTVVLVDSMPLVVDLGQLVQIALVGLAVELLEPLLAESLVAATKLARIVLDYAMEERVAAVSWRA